MVILAQHKEIVSVDVLFPCQYFTGFDEEVRCGTRRFEWNKAKGLPVCLTIEISKVREVHEIHEIHCLIIEILSPISEIISSKSMLNIEIHKIHDIHLSQLPSIHLLATK